LDLVDIIERTFDICIQDYGSRCTNDLFLGSQREGKVFTTGGDSIPLTTQ
jgi:hypothetical protein